MGKQTTIDITSPVKSILLIADMGIKNRNEMIIKDKMS